MGTKWNPNFAVKKKCQELKLRRWKLKYSAMSDYTPIQVMLWNEGQEYAVADHKIHHIAAADGLHHRYASSGDVIHPQLRCGSGYETKVQSPVRTYIA